MSDSGMFNNMFCRVGQGMCRLGLNGQIAVKTDHGYKTYDVKTNRLTNVGSFAFDVGQELFFVVPTTKVKPGDILLINGKPKCVISNSDNKTIRVMSYEDSTIQEILPERHMFLGQTYFYSKIVSMLGNSFLKGEKGVSKIFKLMMMREMLGGGNSRSGDNSPMGGMMGMFMMSQMMGGEGGFGDMFDLGDIELEASEEDSEKESKAEKE